MTGPSRKVICDVCSKELCASSLRGHMQKIHKGGMMTTTTAVEKTMNTTPVVEGVEAPSSVEEVEGVSKTPAPAEHKNVENEESTFIEMTTDHVQNTEANRTEELENAEILKSVEEFEKVRDEM